MFCKLSLSATVDLIWGVTDSYVAHKEPRLTECLATNSSYSYVVIIESCSYQIITAPFSPAGSYLSYIYSSHDVVQNFLHATLSM